MKISVISFTKTGKQLAERIRESMDGEDETVILYTKCSRKKTVQTAKNSGDVTTQTFGGIPNKDSNVPTDNTGDTIAVQESVSAWAGEQMAAHHALIFIGACGIAVRAIAPWIMDKLHDSPVLVADEMGKYVIPLLSGHVGGANELAVRLAGALGAIPVITTATDLHDSFAMICGSATGKGLPECLQKYWQARKLPCRYRQDVWLWTRPFRQGSGYVRIPLRGRWMS